MDLDSAFPFRVFISRRERADRRAAFLPRIVEAAIGNIQWFPAIEPSRLNSDARGFSSLPKRSLALGKRLVLRLASTRKARAVLILEDDAVFHPKFRERIAALELPSDWGIFYLGCQHIERPDFVSPGVVRVRRALDGHAFAVRADQYLRVRAAMRGLGKKSRGSLHSDVLLSRLHREVPTYAAYPNLAWQAESFSDLAGKTYSNYAADGSQRRKRELLDHLQS